MAAWLPNKGLSPILWDSIGELFYENFVFLLNFLALFILMCYNFVII